METLHVGPPPAASPCAPCAPLEQPSPSPQLIAPATEKEKICVMLRGQKSRAELLSVDKRTSVDRWGQVDMWTS